MADTDLALIPDASIEQAKRRCVGAGEKIWTAYHDPDSGQKVREDQLAIAASRTSAPIFGLAQYAQEICPRKYRPHEVFAALCAYTELKLKERHSVDNLGDALPCWKVNKSTLLNGMRDGLDPLEFKTEYEFRKASMEARLSVLDTRNAAADHQLSHSTTESPSPEQRSDSVSQSLRIEPARRFIRNTSIAGPLKLVLAQLMVESDYIKKGKEDEAQKILATARDALLELVDRRRVKDEATKLALEKLSS